MRYANIFIESYSVLINFILIYYLYFHRNNMRRQKNWFLVMLVANTCMTMADMTDWLLSYNPAQYTDVILTIGMVIYFLCSGVLIVSYTYYLLAYLDIKINCAVGIVSGIFGMIQILLAFGSPFASGHLFFYIGEDHAYHRGDLFLLSQLTAVVVYVMQIILLIRKRHRLRREEVLFLTSYIILPVSGELLQVIFYDVALLNVATTIALLLIFINVQSSQELRIEKTEAMGRAKTEFIANMSHEIRTPINAILGMNEIILRESMEENIQEYSENIKSASRKLLGIINDILDFSKIESQKMEIIPAPYHLSSLLYDLHNLIADRAEKKGLEIRFEVMPDMPEYLLGDETRLNQIALNLLTNAVKYTQKGFVECFVGYERYEDKIRMKLEVRDSGIGIKENDINRLFDSFQRLDEKRNRSIEGTGLGLSIVKQLVELMGGDLNVCSTYGEGSCFTVWVPQSVLSEEPIGDFRNRMRRHTKEKNGNDSRLVAPGAKVLAVDDNKMNLKVLQGLMKRTQVQLDLAKSGEEALLKVKENHYDLILLDHRMPHMDGIETLQIMVEKNLLGSVPVIALTANAISGAREMYIQNGFQDYLSKPISGDMLEEMLKRWLPGEKIQQMDNGQDTEQSENENLLQNLGKFLDMPLALEYAGNDKEGLFMNLSFFCENAPGLQSDLKEDFEKKDYKNYSTHVHALKSNAKTIGAMELSEMARKMEIAGDEKRAEQIEEEHPKLMDAYRSLLKELKKRGFGSGH